MSNKQRLTTQQKENYLKLLKNWKSPNKSLREGYWIGNKADDKFDVFEKKPNKNEKDKTESSDQEKNLLHKFDVFMTDGVLTPGPAHASR